MKKLVLSLLLGGGSLAFAQSNDFAFKVFPKLGDEKQNLVFSPFSISSALMMTAEGAKGKTLDEMKAALSLSEDFGVRNSDTMKAMDTTNVELKIANRLWIQEGLKPNADYKSRLEKYYGGAFAERDFKSNAEKSRLEINRWIQDQTKDKIKNLLPELSVTAATRLIITNAVYFYGKWMTPFEKDQTKEAEFFVSKTETKKTKFMNKQLRAGFHADRKLQALKLPYKGRDYSFVIVMPFGQKTPLSSLRLDAKNFEGLLKKMRIKDVIVSVPKFKMEFGENLVPALKQLGMNQAFADKADFSLMTSEPLQIGQVQHKAFIDVTESGTEAAAATAVVMLAMSAQLDKPVSFTADHPFLFFIMHEPTQSVLFMGRYAHP